MLQRLGVSQLALSDYEVNALMTALVAVSCDVVPYAAQMDFMIDVLVQLNREQKVAERMPSHV